MNNLLFDKKILELKEESVAYEINTNNFGIKEDVIDPIYRVALGVINKCGLTVAVALAANTIPIVRIIVIAYQALIYSGPEPERTLLELYVMVARMIELVDRLGFFEMSLPIRVLIDGMLIAGAAAYAVENLRQGTKSISNYMNHPNGDFSDVICGVVKLALGCMDIITAWTAAKDLYVGTQKFAFLDKQQQESKIKFKSIGSLGEEKSCKAVVFDSQHSELLDPSWDVTEKIYQNCDTLVYRVSSSEEFCSALEDASNRFGQPIDVLSMQGHGNPFVQEIGYIFTAQSHELKCLDEHLAVDAQILSLGCNTATTGITETPIAEKLSKGLPGREVKGIASYLNPFFLFTRFNGKNFSLSHWIPVKLGVEAGECVFKFAFGDSIATMVS